MKRTLTTLCLTFASLACLAQTRYVDSAGNLVNPNVFTIEPLYQPRNQLDTVAVIAFCITDTAKVTTEWKKLYAVYGWSQPSVNFNGLMIYKTYLLNDRKTPVNFKVIYSVIK